MLGRPDAGSWTSWSYRIPLRLHLSQLCFVPCLPCPFPQFHTQRSGSLGCLVGTEVHFWTRHPQNRRGGGGGGCLRTQRMTRNQIIAKFGQNAVLAMSCSLKQDFPAGDPFSVLGQREGWIHRFGVIFLPSCSLARPLASPKRPVGLGVPGPPSNGAF